MLECDVLVIGGGPAGSTVSSLLAEKGWSVTQLEKDAHPKFHIGESLLPMNLPILEKLGVLDQVDKIGIRKYGVEFNCESREEPTTYYFKKALNKNHPYAYEVQRAKYDRILFNNAQQKGVDTRENIRVVDVEFHDDGSSTVEARDNAGNQLKWQAKYLVDASGRGTFLGNKFKIKQRSKHHNSAAIFGHFEGVERRTGLDEGNISVYWFEHGWFWFIPFKDGTMSVGAVCWPYYLNSRKVCVEQFLMDTLALCPAAMQRMRNAKLISPVTATGNFSYRLKRMHGKGYLIVGDAFAFIVPVFSSGVLLGMNGAMHAADVVDGVLREPSTEQARLREFENMVRYGLKTFSWFIYRITQPCMRNMFMGPRNWFRMEEGVMSLLAGDLFRDTPIRRPLFFFKLIYYWAYLLDWRNNRASFKRRKQSLKGGAISVEETSTKQEQLDKDV
ncbi:MAG: NAD(P)/FAD-dependent oxidoreductase, partial [Thioalkalispiraceae bacterium]